MEHKCFFKGGIWSCDLLGWLFEASSNETDVGETDLEETDLDET